MGAAHLACRFNAREKAPPPLAEARARVWGF